MRKIFLILSLLIFALLMFTALKFQPTARAGTSYAAKALCSGVFISGLDADRIALEEYEDLSPAFGLLKRRIDTEALTVETHIPMLASSRAAYHPETGCTLGGLATSKNAQSAKPGADRGTFKPLPKSNGGPDIDRAGLNAALDFAFADGAEGPPLRTRAVVIIKNGAVLAERYAEGIGPQTPLKGWSMNKTITGLIIGTMVDSADLRLDAPAPIEAWQGEDDPRRAITLRHLLQMRSGLDFDETYTDMTSDAIQMLFLAPSASTYAVKSSQGHESGTHWYYSSGTTNILAAIAGDVAKQQGTNLGDYMWSRLFTPLGITSANMEYDQGGDFVGSSFGYLAAHDWARLGLLMLRGGQGPKADRIVSEAWIKFMISPNGISNGIYGGQTWLNAGVTQNAAYTYSGVPADMFYFSGHDGQFVVVIPSRDLVVVRLGESAFVNTNAYLGELLRKTLAAIPT